ncbi:hypothetical protein, partial [Corynebacterium diphtheriae]|uniref:hypothetical protein n=1 Tax=Corynebacterium diphtheriae TaxID=1717 RepID=UPI000B74782F
YASAAADEHAEPSEVGIAEGRIDITKVALPVLKHYLCKKHNNFAPRTLVNFVTKKIKIISF